MEQNKAHKSSRVLHSTLPVKLLFIVLFLANCAFLPAVDFLLRPKGFVFIPMGQGNLAPNDASRYEIGGGADIGIELDLSTILKNPLGIGYTVGIEGGLTSNAVKTGAQANLMIYSLGGAIGVYYFPLSRLFVRVDGSVGVFVPSLDKANGPAALFWRGGGEIGFRFTPSLLVAANAGWRQFGEPGFGFDLFNSGISAGLTAQFTFQTGSASASSGAEGTLDQFDPIYPAFVQLYQTNPIGTLSIRNRENAEIRNVRVSFRAAPYTASELVCGTVSSIPKGSDTHVSLYADFSSDVLRFSDSGRILGEVVIRYTFLGQERTTVSPVIVASHNRNTIAGGDLAALGAFISPTSPEILEYSKYITGIARANRRNGHNQNMQYAIWLFEGLRASGIRMGDTYSGTNEAQFPSETLAYRTGSSRDIALLFAASLESIGISSALINVGTDYIVAVDLAVDPAGAETLFNSSDRVLNINEEIWLPVAMSSFNEGFMASWTRAIVSLNSTFERGEFVNFISTKDAWSSYPPAPLPELGGSLIFTDAGTIAAEAEKAVNQYVSQDIMPLAWSVEAQIIANPAAATAALYNRMGILLARGGRTAEAKTNYERAAGMGSVAAMNNRGSLALFERDYNAAEYWFRRVLERDNGNNTALQGIERVESRR